MATTLNRKEVADRLGVAPVTIDRLERDGALKRLPAFDSPRYSTVDVEILEGGGTEGLVKKLMRELSAKDEQLKWYEKKFEMVKNIIGG